MTPESEPNAQLSHPAEELGFYPRKTVLGTAIITTERTRNGPLWMLMIAFFCAFDWKEVIRWRRHFERYDSSKPPSA